MAVLTARGLPYIHTAHADSGEACDPSARTSALVPAAFTNPMQVVVLGSQRDYLHCPPCRALSGSRWGCGADPPESAQPATHSSSCTAQRAAQMAQAEPSTACPP
jgi:hypothetical protein